MISSRRSRQTAALALAVLLAAVPAACSSDDDNAVDDTVVATTTSTIPTQIVGDGQLVIGALLPLSNTLLGEPMASAVETAVDRMNSAGGVLGERVTLVVADEGSSTATAAASIQTLLGSDVDAIIGPASSLVALSTLDEMVTAGKVVCSPTASALALDGFPDQDLFFRTVPSDSLQARAIAGAADQTGAQRVTIAFVDDAYGRPFADSVEASLANEAIVVVDRVPLSAADDDLSDQARAVVDSDPQVLVLLADGEGGTRFLEALDDVDTSGVASIVVNDAFRNPASPQRIQTLDTVLREKIVGLAPQAESTDVTAPFDPPGPYAVNAYDCANLIALSAVLAGSDAPRDIARQLSQVSVNGSACTTFEECVNAIEGGLQIDYNGPSGVTDLLARTGDPSRAVFDRFTFNETGRDVLQRTVIVGS
ncbi:MAG TPA: ABC transporter substrate-binding protein [Ilumatobacteraceae bacterium]|nr:ABC transporter substrate-binding protein [Ilumatobacteraceae bacterium]